MISIALEPLVYLAVLFAIASPVLAWLLRKANAIASMAVLEGAVLLCAIALLLTPTYWPLIVAAIPLGSMLISFPRAR